METGQFKQFQIDETNEGLRLDKFLCRQTPEVTRSFFQKLIKDGHVLLDGMPAKANCKVKIGQRVDITIPPAEEMPIVPEDIPLDILYEDQDLLVVNKPKGMVVHPSAGHSLGTLVNAVMFHCKESLSGINGELRPGIVHRIDRDTTGSLIVCKNDESHVHIAKQIKEHSVKRIYRGIVSGTVKEAEGRIEGNIGRHPVDRKKMSVVQQGGKPAVTHYRVLEQWRNAAYGISAGDRADASDPGAYGKYRASAAWRYNIWKLEESISSGRAGAACDDDRVYTSADRGISGSVCASAGVF